MARTRRLTNQHKNSKSTWFYYTTYVILAVLVLIQLGFTLYQVGLGISYQAKLAQLNQQYQLLSKEKTDLSVELSQELTLNQAQAKAKEQGYHQLKVVALTSATEKLAVLP